jgi:hypothetical protein
MNKVKSAKMFGINQIGKGKHFWAKYNNKIK